MFSLVNPRHRRRHHRKGHRRHHRRHHYGINPRRHHRGGGSRLGMLSMIQRPGEAVSKGLFGVLGAFLPTATANWLLPFPGTDIMSKVLRFGSRAAAAGLLVNFGRPMAGRYAEAMNVGAYIGVAGGTLLDFLGTRIVVGYGDTTQTPGQLLAGFGSVGSLFGAAPATTTGTVAGLASGYYRGRPGGVGALGAAYVAGRPGRLAGIHGGGTRSMGPKHGLFGGM